MRKNFTRRRLVLTLGTLMAAIAALPRWITQVRGGSADVTAWIDSETLAAATNGGTEYIILDVRSPEEFTGLKGHIKGARNIPVERLAAEPSTLGLPHDHSIVMVCLTDKRSEKAAKALREAGFGRIFVLRGGMQKWNAEHRPIEQAAIRA